MMRVFQIGTRWFVAAAIGLGSAGCSKTDQGAGPVDFRPEVPDWFPPISEPLDNEHTTERWELGKSLFFDKDLSRHGTVSCGSCHLPAFAFSDIQPLSTGDLGAIGVRNTPALFNLAYHPYFTRDGGVPTLEMQVAVPVQEHHEFNFEMTELVQRLAARPEYEQAAKKAYGRSFDAFVLTRALAVFERSLISGFSAYDRFVNGEDGSALSPSGQRGMELFFSERTNCSQCHGGFNFSLYAFENNGLYAEYEDVGRMKLTHSESDNGRFKTASLRNVAVTAPYMHDGSLADLETVIEHYNSGGANHPNKSPLIKPLNLTDAEKADLVSFLRSLTDYEFLNNTHFRP